MSFEWKNYVSVAETISTFNTEAYYRAAISRAYYAAYNCCRRFVKNRGFSIGRKSPHAQVQQCLEALGLDEVATTLEELKKLRESADYEDDFNHRLGDVKTDAYRNSIEWTKEILAVVAP